MVKHNSPKRVLIIGYFASYGGSAQIVSEFRKRSDWETLFIVMNKDKSQGFWKEQDAMLWTETTYQQRLNASKFLHSATLTIIAGSPSLEIWHDVIEAKKTGKRIGKLDRLLSNDLVDRISRRVRRLKDFCLVHPTAVLITDSYLLMQPQKWNSIYQSLQGIHLFAMPDLIPYIGTKTIPFLPPVSGLGHWAKRDSDSQIVVAHSPSKPSRYDQKGTTFIQEAAVRNNIPLKLITNLTHQEAIEEKAKVDLFIDQVSYRKFKDVDWEGGIGKSGLEAMLLGCCVMASGILYPTEPYFPCPPVVMVNRSNFEQELIKLFNDREQVRELGRMSRIWAEQYVTPEYVVDHLIRYTLQGTE